MDGDSPKATRRGSRWGKLVIAALVLVALLAVGRALLPGAVEWYVNRTLDQSPLYDGRIEEVDLHLLRGAYTIHGVRLVKTTGNVPVPLFASDRIDLAIQWDALLAGEIVGRVAIDRPELNFVDAGDEGSGDVNQTGAGGPWLAMIRDLFPFRINSVTVNDGSIHFRALHGEEPVNVYLSDLEARVENLTNIHDEVTPLVTTVEATGLAMGEAPFEYEMKLDPFTYRPTFELVARLLNLDVTELNQLTRTYGAFDFEKGWFDLVIELEANEGMIEGYVKPLFRDVQVLSLRNDLRDEDALRLFWEALVGGAAELLQNQPRDQLGTLIPFSGDATAPEADVLTTVANVLYNAFIRAYLPNLQRGDPGDTEEAGDEGLTFEPAKLEHPAGVE